MSCNLTENITLNEVRCKCCGLAIVRPKFVELVQSIRDMFNNPLIVHLWTRCDKNNTRVEHTLGLAVDFSIKNIDISYLHEQLKKWHSNQKKYGLGLYPWGVHLQLGDYKKWNG